VRERRRDPTGSVKFRMWRSLPMSKGAAMRMLIACILSLFASVEANALSGTELYRSCSDKKNGLGDFMCVAFVHGFLDGLAFGQGIGKASPPFYCPPEEGISVDQGRLIIEKYLRDHPEQLHLQAGENSASALVEAFRCKN
jgi:Ssp1 endopeptidase immunity protein Rap1a